MAEYQYEFMYKWLLIYISNDLLWYTMQHDFELALKLLKTFMDYDIYYRQNYPHLHAKSFIDFPLIEVAFKVIIHYDPHGLNYKHSFLAVQQTLIQNYSPQIFHPISSSQDIRQIFIDLLSVNIQYESFHDLVIFFRFKRLKDQWGLDPDVVLRKMYLDAAIKFCHFATENRLNKWVCMIINI